MPHSRWLDFHGEVMVLCGSLIRFDGQRGELNLIHQTARDFLESFVERARPDEVGGVGLGIVAANTHLAETCVEYLLQDGPFCELEKVLRSKNAFKDYAWIIAAFLRDHPFICYVIENWSFHIRAVEEPQGLLVEKITQLPSSQKRGDGIMRLTYVSTPESPFCPFITHRSGARQMYPIFLFLGLFDGTSKLLTHKQYINHQGNPFSPTKSSALHLASYFDLPFLVSI
jgi:hypothetical protein